jgi:hypothetical protein
MPAFAASAYTVSIEGKPSLQNQLMPSVEWSGGSMQLSVKVRVLDDRGTPAKGVQVRVSAQSAGAVARLRGFGFTGPDGLATVITSFDVPVISLAKVSLSACTTEPEPGDCSITGVYDLRRRWDIEAESTYSENAGNQVFSLTSHNVVPTETILSTGSQFEALGRLVLNLYSGGSVSRTTTWSAFGESGGYFLRDTLYGQSVAYFGGGVGSYVLKTVSSTGFHPTAEAGVQGEEWGRLFIVGSFDPPLGGNPGTIHAQAAWAQPLGRRIEVVGGYAIDLPEFAGSQSHYGSARGPLFGFVFSRARNAAMSVTVLGSYVSAGGDQFQSSGNTPAWSILATTSPGLRVSVDYHRGGPAYVSFYVAGQQLSTASKTFEFGTTITFRDFIPRSRR